MQYASSPTIFSLQEAVKVLLAYICTNRTAVYLQLTYARVVPLTGSNNFQPYCDICSSLPLVYPVFPKELERGRWDDHCNRDGYLNIHMSVHNIQKNQSFVRFFLVETNFTIMKHQRKLSLLENSS